MAPRAGGGAERDAPHGTRAGEPLPLFDDLPPVPAGRSGPRPDVPVGVAAAPLALPARLAPYRHLLRLGTSSWSFPGWQGLVWDTPRSPYAEGRLPRAGLPAYASHPLLSAVGIDRGFYAPIGVDEYARYAAQVPAGAGLAIELRDASLLTPRLVDALRETGVAYCIGLHDRMPPVERQLRALDRLHAEGAGPLVARWTLHAGIGYEAARHRYAPFDALVDPDPATRLPLATACAAALIAGQPVTVIANNKAEGSAPRTLALLAGAIAAAP
jgi:hypothetical protein